MNMQESVLYIVLALLCVVIYLLITQRKNKEEVKNSEEFVRLKDSLNSSLNTMSASFNTLSKDVTRDMTQALTKVDEKVGVFNRQVEDLNKSHEKHENGEKHICNKRILHTITNIPYLRKVNKEYIYLYKFNFLVKLNK